MISNNLAAEFIGALIKSIRRGTGQLAGLTALAIAVTWLGNLAPVLAQGPNLTVISVTPSSPTTVGNCIPFGQNSMFGFQGFIYRELPAFSIEAGDRLRFDLGHTNDVDVRRNIYIAQANISPAAGGASQGVRALSWVKLVSDSQIPENPRGNFVVGDYELTYTAEVGFDFAGGGFIIGFGSATPGDFRDENCDPVVVGTTSGDISGKFHRRFYLQANLSLNSLDDAGISDNTWISGFIVERNVENPPTIVAADDEYSVNEDTTLNVPAPSVLGNDTATHEHGGLTAILVSGPTHGTLTLAPDGSFSYTPAANHSGWDSFSYKATDGSVESGVATAGIMIFPVNDAPVNANDAYTLQEDTTLTIVAPGVLSNDTDVENDALTTLIVSGPAHGTVTFSPDGSFYYTPVANYNGSDSFIYKVNDGLIDSGNATVELIITAINDGPNITINDSSISANEGSAAANSGSWSDVDSTVTIIARDQSNATIGSISVAGQNWFWNYNGTDDLQTVVTVTVTDSFGASDSTSFSLDVNNVAPTAVFTAPLNHVVQAVDTDITFSAQITDPGAFDTHVGAFKFEAPGMDPIVVGAQISGNTASATLAFLEPGVYTTSLTISDDDGGITTTQLEQFVVNYDPSAGFVTGGGWIDSPAGSLISAPTVTGKANFGFVSKYKKGVTVPVGNTEFQFKAGGLNFKSASYEWLLVSGARAQFRGIGTINGEGEYAFILTAVDGQLPGGDNTDKFRMKIWNRGGSHDVVYDNAAESAISGGSIVIHR